MTHRQKTGEFFTFVTLVSLVAYAAIATDLYLPAIPYIIADLDATASQGQLTLSIFMVGLATGQLIFGPLSDRYGRLPVVRLGTLLFLITSVSCALVWSMELMWLVRGLQGVAAASGPVIARAIVRDRYEGNRASQVMSVLSAAMAVIPMVAPSIGAFILGFSPWPGVFFALAFFALTVLIALARFPETAARSIDDGLTFTRVLLAFRSMLATQAFIGYQIAGSFSFAALFCYLSTVAYFLPDVFDIPTSLFGYAFALTVFGFMSGSLVNASLVMRYGMDKTLRAGLITSLVSAVCIALLAAKAQDHMPHLAFLSSTFFFGVGLTAANASMGAISLFQSQAGAASAVYGFTHALLASLVGAIAGGLYAGRLLEPALIVLACSLIAIGGLWLIPRSEGSAQRSQ